MSSSRFVTRVLAGTCSSCLADLAFVKIIDTGELRVMCMGCAATWMHPKTVEGSRGATEFADATEATLEEVRSVGWERFTRGTVEHDLQVDAGEWWRLPKDSWDSGCQGNFYFWRARLADGSERYYLECEECLCKVAHPAQIVDRAAHPSERVDWAEDQVVSCDEPSPEDLRAQGWGEYLDDPFEETEPSPP